MCMNIKRLRGYHIMTNRPRLLNLSTHAIIGTELEELAVLPLNAAYPKDTL